MIGKIFIIPLLLGSYFSVRSSCESNYWYGIDDSVNEDYGEEIQQRYVWSDITNGSYFGSLTTNFGNNQTHATCGYVALAMLLRYYDIYVNDSIVSSGYEVAGSNGSSAGTLFEPNLANLPHDPDNVPAYYNFLRNYKNSSLHAYLVLFDKGALNFNPPNNFVTLT